MFSKSSYQLYHGTLLGAIRCNFCQVKNVINIVSPAKSDASLPAGFQFLQILYDKERKMKREKKILRLEIRNKLNLLNTQEEKVDQSR